MSKFELNKTYETRSICNSECIITATILKRSEKTVTAEVTGVSPKNKVFRIVMRDGVETFRPWGSYSMAPTIKAA